MKLYNFDCIQENTSIHITYLNLNKGHLCDLQGGIHAVLNAFFIAILK